MRNWSKIKNQFSLYYLSGGRLWGKINASFERLFKKDCNRKFFYNEGWDSLDLPVSLLLVMSGNMTNCKNQVRGWRSKVKWCLPKIECYMGVPSRCKAEHFIKIIPTFH